VDNSIILEKIHQQLELQELQVKEIMVEILEIMLADIVQAVVEALAPTDQMQVLVLEEEMDLLHIQHGLL